MKKILSIIIPIYNVEKYLENCLRSIVTQLTDEVELILINDGSKDSSKDICKKYLKKENIKYIEKENEGCSITRNLGISIATGKYMWFIDSDDYIENEAIKKILLKLRNKDLDILVFGYKRIENNNFNVVIPKNIGNKENIYKQYEIFNSPCNKIYKKDILIKNYISFPKNSHMGEDMVFNFKVFFFSKKIDVLNEYFYNYLDTGGATANLEKRIGIYYSFDEIVDFFKKNNSFDKMKNILREYYELHAVKIPYNFIMYQATKQKFDKKIEINKIRNEIKKRKDLFNSNFYFLQLFYTLKMKIYFIRPLYRKILRLVGER